MSSYRFCRTDDIALLVDALNRCGNEPPMTPAAFKQSIRDLQVWCSSCMVAFAGADPIGVLIGAKRPSATLVHKIAVHPDHRRQGHGRHLLDSLGSKLAILGPPRIVAEVPETLAAACGLFSASGYVQEAVLTDYDWQHEGTGAPGMVGEGRFVIPVTVDDLAANGLLQDDPTACWQRSVETLTARKDDIEGLAVATDERIEAYLLYTQDGEIVALRSLIDDGRAGLKQLLARVGVGTFRFAKVHPAEMSNHSLETLGFRPTGKHRLYGATLRPLDKLRVVPSDVEGRQGSGSPEHGQGRRRDPTSAAGGTAGGCRTVQDEGVMTKSVVRSSLASLVLCAALVLWSGSAQTQRDTSSADARLRALYTEEWNWRQQEMAPRSNGPGGAGAIDRLRKVDAASQQARLAYWTRALATLDTIPFNDLSPDEKVNAQVFRASIRALANDVRFRTYEAPFNSDTFFWTDFTPRQRFAAADTYRAYLGRLRDVPRYFDEQITNMRTGLARGFSVPRVSVVGRDKTIEPYVMGATANPLYAPFTQMPTTITSADRAELRAEAESVIRDVVVPAYQRLLTFMRTEYLPKARTTLAATAMPDGDAYYQAMIEKFTTLNLTAKQIHEIGLTEVARIEKEMEETKRRANFSGTMAQFFQFLRTDPQFYAKTPRELLSYSAYVSKKADWKLGETIGFLPRRRHGIRPVPEALAPIYTGGRGGLEACLMNTYNLPARPLYTLAALTLHECTPGHSFQAALALEGPERPAFRRGTSFSGYGEGWGLYTEWLGTVMGIYETPYEDFGRLTYEMWRACRLVIDTGIHAFGWSREQAMDYLRTRAALSEHEITTEVERYIAWPAQALAYKLGELQIRRHRREAEEKLGPKFDQREFHDAILAIGSVPLPVLEQRMAQFIADGGVNPPDTNRH